MRYLPVLLCVLLCAGCGRRQGAAAYEDAREALRRGDWRRAEERAQLAVELGGAIFEARRAFVRGNVAFARCEAAEAEAARGDAEAAKAALKHAEDALAYWQWAARSRRDWPAARRNVERALLKLAAIRETRGGGEAEPEPPRPTDGDEAEPPPEPALAFDDLPAGEVLGLFEVLGRREVEKIRLRRAQRATGGARVERDW